MIQSPGWLYVPYAANILILLPVCWSLFLSGGTTQVFNGNVEDSEGLRFLVGSLYLAILLASVAGLVWPAFFVPLILVQILYKSLWLCTYVLPKAAQGDPVPTGIAVTFAAIIITYPVFLWLASRPS